jgi:hypothetical protein
VIQLAVALGTVTIVAVTGVDSILGLGPAVFLIAGALAVGPAGRVSDRVGRMPVIRAGFVLGIAGPLVTAGGCAWRSGVLVFAGLPTGVRAACRSSSSGSSPVRSGDRSSSGRAGLAWFASIAGMSLSLLGARARLGDWRTSLRRPSSSTVRPPPSGGA